MIATKLTVNDIECLLVTYFGGCQAVLAVPNVSWGLLDHEADFVVVTKRGYLSEVEIKRSWADFLNDFKKKHRHEDSNERISRFFYAVPEAIADKVVAFLDEDDERRKHVCGVLVYVDEPKKWQPSVYEKKQYRARNKGAKALTIEEQYQLARLGTLRMWSLKNKNFHLYGKK